MTEAETSPVNTPHYSGIGVVRKNLGFSQKSDFQAFSLGFDLDKPVDIPMPRFLQRLKPEVTELDNSWIFVKSHKTPLRQ